LPLGPLPPISPLTFSCKRLLDSSFSQLQAPTPLQAAVLARFPNSNGRDLVFSARGHLWTVPLAGGEARELTSGAGYETAPHFSPDGRWIAFTGDRGGQQDVYVMPSVGGTPRRLTWLSVPPSNGVRRTSQEGLIIVWTPDSRGIVFLSRRQGWNSWQYRPFTVPVSGGEPVALPVDRSGYRSRPGVCAPHLQPPQTGPDLPESRFRNGRFWRVFLPRHPTRSKRPLRLRRRVIAVELPCHGSSGTHSFFYRGNEVTSITFCSCLA
jgi:hypothetical protein